jgi:hypothetical protein
MANRPSGAFAFGAILSPMALTTAAAALDILNGTWTAIQNMRERVKSSKDNELKESYGNLLDDFNALRVVVLKLTEENTELRRAQEEKPEIRHVGDVNYYYVGEKGPYCQPCYDGKGKLVPLTAQQRFSGGMGRNCQVCHKVFLEYRFPPEPQGPPSHWMS